MRLQRTELNLHPDPIFLIDPRSTAFLTVNDAAPAYYRYSKQLLLQKTLADISAPEQVAQLKQLLQTQTRDLRILGPYRQLRGDGTWATMSLVSFKIHVGARALNLLFARPQPWPPIETEPPEARIQEGPGTIEAMRGTLPLKRSRRARTRRLLRRIIDNSGWIDRKRATLELTERMLNRAALSNSLLDLTETDAPPIVHRVVNLSRLAQKVARRWCAEHSDSKLSIAVLPDLSAFGDPILLSRLLTLLIDSAHYQTHDRADPSLIVGASPLRGETVYYVRDNGVGFDPACLPALSAESPSGDAPRDLDIVYLRTAVARHMVERQGGRLWVDSAHDVGTTTYFTLPRTLLAAQLTSATDERA